MNNYDVNHLLFLFLLFISGYTVQISQSIYFNIIVGEIIFAILLFDLKKLIIPFFINENLCFYLNINLKTCIPFLLGNIFNLYFDFTLLIMLLHVLLILLIIKNINIILTEEILNKIISFFLIFHEFNILLHFNNKLAIFDCFFISILDVFVNFILSYLP